MPTRLGVPLHRLARTTLDVAAILGALVTLAVAVALVSGVRPVVFLSGSMSPGIGAGALGVMVPVAADEIRPGQVVSAVRDDGLRVTHRALEVEHVDGRALLSMRGDANELADTARYDVTDGADRVVWHAEGLGALITTPRLPWYLAGAALVVIGLLPGTRATNPGARATDDGRHATHGGAHVADGDPRPVTVDAAAGDR